MCALLSVADADQDGFVRLVERLWSLEVELLATPGTRDGLARQGVSVDALTVVPADDLAIAGEALTFHPDVFAGILARRDQAQCRDADPAFLIDGRREAMGEIVGERVEGIEPCRPRPGDIGEEFLRREPRSVRARLRGSGFGDHPATQAVQRPAPS